MDDGPFVARGWTRRLSGRVRMEIRDSMIAAGADVDAARVLNAVVGPRTTAAGTSPPAATERDECPSAA